MKVIQDNSIIWLMMKKTGCQIGGKGVIPCKKTESHEDLDAVPESDLLSILEFYSSLKDEIINEKS